MADAELQDRRPEEPAGSEAEVAPAPEEPGYHEEPIVVVTRARTPLSDAIRYLLAGVLIAVIAIFAAANREPIALDFVVTERTVRLAWIVLGTAAVGALAGLALFSRRRR